MEIYAPLAGRMGMQEHARGAGGARLPAHQPGGLPHRRPSASPRCPSATSGVIGEIEKTLAAHARRRTASRPTVKGRQKTPYSIWRKMERKARLLRAAFRHFRLPRASSDRSRSATAALGVVHTTWPMVPGALQGLHLDAEAERLPLDPHHRGRPGQPARRAADPHRGDGPHRRIRHRRACPLQGRAATATAPAHAQAKADAYRWLRRTIELLAEGDNPEEFLEHTKLELFHDQVFCFTPKGRADRAAARRDPHRLRLCGAHRCRQHRRSAPRSTAASCRC